MDYYRSRSKVHILEPLAADETGPADETDFTMQVQDRIVAERICDYVGQLPPDTQRIFRLHIWGEYTFKEIAAILDLPESSVKTKYYRLIHLLRKEFSLYGQ